MAIIKCPECGHDVSNLAPQCPTCGVEILNNITTCPDCGKVLLLKEERCPNCGCELVSHATNSVKQAQTSAPSARYPQNGPKKKQSHTTIWVFFSIIFVVILSVAGYFFYQEYTQKQQMGEAYTSLQNDTNVENYENFLNMYPNSTYTRDVTERMNQLKTIQNKWVLISMSSSKNDFVQFMNQFPNSAFENACKTKIDSLDWIDANTTNTVLSYQRYMDEHPNGAYFSEAKIGKDNIGKMEVSFTEKNKARDLVTRYFDALSTNDVTSLGDAILPKMYEQTVEFMHKMHTENSQVSFQIQSPFSVMKAPSPSADFVYIVNNRLVRTLTSLTGEVSTIMLNALTTVSPQMQIISVKMTRIEEAE